MLHSSFKLWPFPKRSWFVTIVLVVIFVYTKRALHETIVEQRGARETNFQSWVMGMQGRPKSGSPWCQLHWRRRWWPLAPGCRPWLTLTNSKRTWGASLVLAQQLSLVLLISGISFALWFPLLFVALCWSNSVLVLIRIVTFLSGNNDNDRKAVHVNENFRSSFSLVCSSPPLYLSKYVLT